MKISFKKLVLLFSIGAFATYGIVMACVDSFFDYDYDSSFTPEAYVDDSYKPLFYAPSEMFYGYGYETDNVTRFNDLIANEWSDYLKGKMSPAEITFLLLNDSAQAIINSLYKATKTKTKPSISYGKFNLEDAKVKGFIEFLYYAKIIEDASAIAVDPWNYDETQAKSFVDAKTITAVEKLYSETKDVFLKNRYWFQIMKGYFYSDGEAQIIPFFEKTKATVPHNSLYYRGLAYVAGVHYGNKNYATSNYLYSVVFDEYPALRTVTAYNFHPAEDYDFNASLSLAKTNKEKAAIWALLGFYTNEQTAIKEIYKLDPANEHLDYLLTRLINKQEVTFNAGNFVSASEYKQSVKKQTNPDALALVSQIAKEGKTKQPDLWNAGAGYLNTFAGNYVLANQYLEKAGLKNVKGSLPESQIRLLKLINTLYSIDKIDEKTEAKLLPELAWLYATCGSDETFRCEHAATWSRRYIASMYTSQKKLVMAELFNHDEKFFRTESNLALMKTFLMKTARSSWEQLAVSLYNITLSDVNEYQSVMSAYAEDLDASISFMEQSKAGQNVVLLGNPFNGKIKDCHDCDHAAPQKVKYAKLFFLQKMKEMKANVEKGEDVYNNSLLLANAYYNMTYYGNARVFYENAIVNQYGNDIDPFYHPQLLSCATARKYYQKAFDAATNPEQKAKCVYMMTKCERNEYYNTYYASGNLDDVFVAWEGFKKLKSEYSNTRYYKDVINECGYFRSYLGIK
jgi:hypothetical protein